MATMLRGPALTILGRQGSGKGTQAARLTEHLGTVHLSTGDLLRAAVADGSNLGRQVAHDLETGHLVDDQLMLDVVAATLAAPGVRRRGFVLDGYPRNTEQADDLLGLLAPDGLDAAIVLDVPLPEVRRRMAARRVCVTCGASVSATGDEDEVPCPVCGGVAVRRPDDTPEAIDRRLATYEAEAGPLAGEAGEAAPAGHRGRHRRPRRGVRAADQGARPSPVGARSGRRLTPRRCS